MAVKKCSKCKEEKHVSEFSKRKTRNNILQSQCKICINKAAKEYYQTNKEYHKEYAKKNKEAQREYHKEYREKNIEHIKKQQKEHRIKNINTYKEYIKEYSKNNRESLNEYQKEYRTNKYKTNPLFALISRLRSRTYIAFKTGGYKKTSKTYEILGADFKIVYKHIEEQFTKGMSWDNMKEWHIDHIIPLASANTEEDLINLCHYTNLQPLWAEDNLSKGASIDNQQGKLRL